MYCQGIRAGTSCGPKRCCRRRVGQYEKWRAWDRTRSDEHQSNTPTQRPGPSVDSLSDTCCWDTRGTWRWLVPQWCNQQTRSTWGTLQRTRSPGESWEWKQGKRDRAIRPEGPEKRGHRGRTDSLPPYGSWSSCRLSAAIWTDMSSARGRTRSPFVRTWTGAAHSGTSSLPPTCNSCEWRGEAGRNWWSLCVAGDCTGSDWSLADSYHKGQLGASSALFRLSLFK